MFSLSLTLASTLRAVQLIISLGVFHYFLQDGEEPYKIVKARPKWVRVVILY